tara:strand:- start:843 stop:1358 length:516 start_codon:yes stop_codon:yes gene_type:complete
MQPKDELQRLARLVDMNKKRLDEIEFQLERLQNVIEEHQSALHSIQAISSSNKGHIPIGAGVMIPLSSEFEPSTLVDLGSGVFAEKTHEDASQLLIKRSSELEVLQNKLLNEREQLTHQITTNSEEFEKLAHVFSSQQDQNQPLEEESEKESQKSQRKPRRRFGSELTLDD